MFDNDMNSKMNQPDRVLVLKPIEGKPTKSASGTVDKRLFTGENTLHAFQDEETCLWGFRYDSGILPGGLQQKFTSFSKAFQHAKDYYDRRNIEISEVVN